jgi:hypothetical protein
MVMKLKIAFFALIIAGLLIGKGLLAQETRSFEPTKLYLVTKHDGAEFLGKIISYDARELLLVTEEIGEIFIPKHVIKTIKEVNPEQFKEFSDEDIFATRYFITTNGLPIKRGENYIQWNLYGPDFQFGIADNLGIGIMTSWVAIPVIGNIKYSIKLGKNTSMALGALLGTGSWGYPDLGLALPFASFTLGNRKNNLTFSAGYGGLFYSEDRYNPITSTEYKDKFSEGRMLLSVAGIAKINSKFSLVFDSFISPWGTDKTYTDWVDKGVWNPDKNEYISNWVQETRTERTPNLALILPGIRWQIDANKAFQFGFTGLYYDGEFLPTPIPMVQWYRKL